MTVVCIGELMAELSLDNDGTARMGFGGDTFNTAAYLSRLGQPTSYLTVFGDDPWSFEARMLVAAEGVDDSASPVATGRTLGLYAIRTSAGGERDFTYWREAAPARGLFGDFFSDRVAQAVLSAQVIYLSGITLWLYDAASLDRLFGLLKNARALGAKIAFDGNYRSRLWGPDPAQARRVYARMLALTDICLATFDDEEMLWGDEEPAASYRRLIAMGASEVVVKCGPDGAMIASTRSIPTRRNTGPVDTTAAGDSFNAAYLTARLLGQDQALAAQAGNRLAGQVIAHRGALIPRRVMDWAAIWDKQQ